MTSRDQRDLGRVAYSHWAGRLGAGATCPDGYLYKIGEKVLFVVVFALNIAAQLLLFGKEYVESSRLLFAVHFLVVPVVLAWLLIALPRVEFRERGARAWRWFLGWRTHVAGPDSFVTWRLGPPESEGGARLLILAASPDDPRPLVLFHPRGRDDPRLLEAALRYSRPRAEEILEQIRSGQGVLWARGIRLDPEGVLGRPTSGGPRTLVPYSRIRDYEVKDDRFRIVADDGTAFEGDTSRANFLSGQIALQEMIGAGSG